LGGSTTRFSKCYCSKCRYKYYKAYLITHRRTIDWNNVSAVAKNGEYITLHCNNCGNEWKSNSKSAHRIFK
jgi:hypothetical protein